LNILDFGRANSGSLEFFNQFSCRLCVLDAADSLLEWSAGLETRMEEPPSSQQMQLELSGVLSSMGAHRYDLVFFWDTLNHIHEHALPAFAGLLRRYLTPNCRGHGFMLHKRGTEQMLRHMGMAGDNNFAVQQQAPTTLYPHNRKVVNDALGKDLRIDQGVLHGDGRLEFLLVSDLPREHSIR
ncbi:MAG: hypothetical protein NWQ45_00955, partial [Congregibacter sp.]|nr:hypothetical protein [Congregibacter sp.]